MGAPKGAKGFQPHLAREVEAAHATDARMGQPNTSTGATQQAQMPAKGCVLQAVGGAALSTRKQDGGISGLLLGCL